MLPRISLIVPTRGRPEQLERFLASLAATTDDPEILEVVLVVDADDPESARVQSGLAIRHVVVPPGHTMGALNTAGYEAATGQILMLLNDDVVARTRGWDTSVRKCFAGFPDGILLLHVNDTVFQKNLCTFPIVSRRFCEMAGGICPPGYQRYRIDDHIEDVFNLLGVLGERRSIYLEDTVFEHLNHVTNAQGVRQYFSEPAALAVDARLFDALSSGRKELALRLKSLIAPKASSRQMAAWQATLDAIADPFALRRPERLRVVSSFELARTKAIAPRETWLHPWRQKVRRKLHTSGYSGLAKAVGRSLLRGIGVLR